MNSTAGIIFGLLSFVVTFALARYLGRGIRKRRAERAVQEAQKQQSRQVRRARERKTR